MLVHQAYQLVTSTEIVTNHVSGRTNVQESRPEAFQSALSSLPFPSPRAARKRRSTTSLCRFLVRTGMINRSPDKGCCISGLPPPGMVACDVSISAVTNRVSAKANRQKSLRSWVRRRHDRDGDIALNSSSKGLLVQMLLRKFSSSTSLRGSKAS